MQPSFGRSLRVLEGSRSKGIRGGKNRSLRSKGAKVRSAPLRFGSHARRARGDKYHCIGTLPRLFLRTTLVPSKGKAFCDNRTAKGPSG